MKLLTKIDSVRKILSLRTAPFFRMHKPKLRASLLDPLAIIGHENQFTYFRIFKAANSTIVASLYHAQTGIAITAMEKIQPIKDNFYDRLSRLSRTQVKKMENSYFKFTFVRNPYSRILAAYQDKVFPRDQGKHRLVAQALGKPDDADLSFEDFLAYLEAGGIDQNAHWARQTDLLPIPLKSLDFVGRTEKIIEDLPDVLERIFGRRAPVISVKEHATGFVHRGLDLDPAIRDRISWLYALDFESFGYKA